MAFRETIPGVWQSGVGRRPSLVMLHGWGGTGPANFGFAAEVLSRDWHVTAVDLAGHGHGTRLASGEVSVGDLAADVDDRLAAAGVSTPSVIVGYSLGGAVAQQMWLDYPQRVSGLVLAATAAKLSPTPVACVALHGWAATTGVTGPLWGAVGAGVRTVLRLGANRGFDVTNMSGVGEHNGPAVQMLARGVANFNSAKWIGGVDVPVGVLVCKNDRLVPTHRQHQLAKLVAADTVVEVPGGHLGFLRHPKLFAAAFRQLTRTVQDLSLYANDHSVLI
jgi:pimeloyl-ACP methyl ester carboxylesterase